MKRFYFLSITILLTLPVLGVQAQSVDLLWQGETYTSPFYKGASLWSTQSRITLVAIPHGLGDPTKLNYKWTKSGTVLGNINGIGRETISFVDSIISRPQTIEVEIISSQSGVLASNSVFIAPIAPTLAVYENNPLYGFMFNREVGKSYTLQDKEITLAGFPFFFSTISRFDNSLKYNWRTNAGGVEIEPVVTYRVPDNTHGASQVSVSASSDAKITQKDNKSFVIQF